MKNLSETISSTLKVRAINCLEARTNLNEHLRSLTGDELIVNLNCYINKDIAIAGDYTYVCANRKAIAISVPATLINSKLKLELFKMHLDMCMWELTEILQKSKNRWVLGIEPIETNDISTLVRKSRWIYHVTSADRISNDYNSNTIISKGFRPKEGVGYRYFSHRIHFIRHTQDIISDIQLIQSQLRISNNDLRLFRIDVSKLNKNIVFYWDSMYETDHFIYAFIKFPSEFVEEISIDDIN